MSILLIRHAKAEREHRLGDSARGLTAKGRRMFRSHARLLASRAAIRRIGTSPLVRAVQTAEILAEAMGVSQVAILPDLAPSPFAAIRIAKLVRELRTGWALVGHNPSLAEAAAKLIGVKEIPVRLKKGSALSLESEGKKHHFEWLAGPGDRWKTRLRR